MSVALVSKSSPTISTESKKDKAAISIPLLFLSCSFHNHIGQDLRKWMETGSEWIKLETEFEKHIIKLFSTKDLVNLRALNRVFKNCVDNGGIGNEIRCRSEIENSRFAAFEKFTSLFGGIKAYNAFPVLDIGERCGHTGYIDFIEAEELNAPFTRGKDCYGRHFVAIRFEEWGKLRCQVIFQRYTCSSNAVFAGNDLFRRSIIINSRGEVNEEAYAELTKAITTKKHKGIKIC